VGEVFIGEDDVNERLRHGINYWNEVGKKVGREWGDLRQRWWVNICLQGCTDHVCGCFVMKLVKIMDLVFVCGVRKLNKIGKNVLEVCGPCGYY